MNLNLHFKLICVLPLLFCVLPTTCVLAQQATTQQSNSTDKQTVEFNPIMEMGIPAAFLPMVMEQAKKQGTDAIPLLIHISDADGKPVAGMEIGVRWTGGKQVVKSNELGQLKFDMGKDNYKGLIFDIPKGLQATLDESMSVEVTMSDGSGKNAEDSLDLEKDFSVLEADSFKIYFGSGHESHAKKALVDLAEMQGFVKGHSGMSLFDGYGIVLLSRMEPMSIKGTVVVPAGADAWGNATTHEENEDTLFAKVSPWIVMHEWLEATLVFGNGIYNQDAGLRYVGDGLAEYYSESYTRYKHPDTRRLRLEEGRKTLQQLVDDRIATYDLLTMFVANVSHNESDSADSTDNEPNMSDNFEKAGYPLSLVFWHNFANANGEAGIREVVTQLRKAKGEIDQHRMAAILKKVSGKDISTTMDVASAIKVLDNMLQEKK